jgi:hypothetical protein
MMKARRAILAVLAAVPMGLSLWTATDAMARKPFDGNWSVLVVTDGGSCDRAYRYALRIVNGRVTYDDPAFNISGHVDASGHANVSISAGGQHAGGSGQLSGNSGQGQWTGRSSTSACSGHWEAERRG